MKGSRKWIGVLSLALSLPSSIAGLAFLINELVQKGFLDIKVGFIIFLLVISSMLWLMVLYAFNKKN